MSKSRIHETIRQPPCAAHRLPRPISSPTSTDSNLHYVSTRTLSPSLTHTPSIRYIDIIASSLHTPGSFCACLPVDAHDMMNFHSTLYFCMHSCRIASSGGRSDLVIRT